jgi:hypothetical protein
MKTIVSALLILGMVSSLVVPTAAAVNVERSGSENPMVEVARSTIYGGLTGLVLGGAIAWARDGDNGYNIVRWGFVAGSFFGFGYGLYHVSSRPSARALLEIHGGTPRLDIPTVMLVPGRGAQVVVVSARF